MPSPKPSENRNRMLPKRAIELLTQMIHNAGFLGGEPFESPQRAEWTDTARGVLERSFPAGSSILQSFETAQSIAFGPDDSDDRLREIANGVLTSSLAVLRSAVKQLSWEDDGAAVVAQPVRAKPALPIFISHSSRDAVLAEAIVDLLRAALGFVASEIRCSSVDGYRLPVGVNTEGRLREEVNAAAVMIGLITPNSLSSSYVVFELGARWGSGLFLAPLLAGVKAGDLSEPLSLLNALSATSEGQLHQLLGDVAKQLGRELENAASYVKHVARVKELAQGVVAAGGKEVAISGPVLPLQMVVAVDGVPPSQTIKVTANQGVSVTRVEYLLSSDTSVAGDDVSFGGETFEVPINYQALMKVWNTYRPDRNNYDHSGPAKLALSISTGVTTQDFILPIQMESFMPGNAMFVKIVGSRRFSAPAPA